MQLNNLANGLIKSKTLIQEDTSSSNVATGLSEGYKQTSASHEKMQTCSSAFKKNTKKNQLNRSQSIKERLKANKKALNDLPLTENEKALIKLNYYDVPPDGACYFRAYLSATSKKSKWLDKKQTSFSDIRNKLLANNDKEKILLSISQATEQIKKSLVDNNYDLSDFLEGCNKKLDSSDLTVFLDNVSTSAFLEHFYEGIFTNEGFYLWDIKEVQQYLSVNNLIPSDLLLSRSFLAFLDLWTTSIFDNLNKNLQVPLNTKTNLYLTKKEGDLHYNLITPANFFEKENQPLKKNTLKTLILRENKLSEHIQAKLQRLKELDEKFDQEKTKLNAEINEIRGKEYPIGITQDAFKKLLDENHKKINNLKEKLEQKEEEYFSEKAKIIHNKPLISGFQALEAALLFLEKGLSLNANYHSLRYGYTIDPKAHNPRGWSLGEYFFDTLVNSLRSAEIPENAAPKRKEGRYHTEYQDDEIRIEIEEDLDNPNYYFPTDEDNPHQVKKTAAKKINSALLNPKEMITEFEDDEIRIDSLVEHIDLSKNNDEDIYQTAYEYFKDEVEQFFDALSDLEQSQEQTHINNQAEADPPPEKETNKGNFFTFQGAQAAPIPKDYQKEYCAQFRRYYGAETTACIEGTNEAPKFDKSNNLKRSRRKFAESPGSPINPEDIVNMNIKALDTRLTGTELDRFKALLNKPVIDKNNIKELIGRYRGLAVELKTLTDTSPAVANVIFDSLDAMQGSFIEQSAEFRKGYAFYWAQNEQSLVNNQEFFSHALVESFFPKRPNSKYLFQQMTSNAQEANAKLLQAYIAIMNERAMGKDINMLSLGMLFAHLDIDTSVHTAVHGIDNKAIKQSRWAEQAKKTEHLAEFKRFQTEAIKKNLPGNTLTHQYFSQNELLDRFNGKTKSETGFCDFFSMNMILAMEDRKLESLDSSIRTMNNFRQLITGDPIKANRVVNAMQKFNMDGFFVKTQANTVTFRTNLDALVERIYESKNAFQLTVTDLRGDNGHSLAVTKVKVGGKLIPVFVDANSGLQPILSKDHLKSCIRTASNFLADYDSTDAHMTFANLYETEVTPEYLANLDKQRIKHRYKFSYLHERIAKLEVDYYKYDYAENPAWQSLFPSKQDETAIHGTVDKSAYSNSYDKLLHPEVLDDFIRQAVNKGSQPTPSSLSTLMPADKKGASSLAIAIAEDPSAKNAARLLDAFVETQDASAKVITTDPKRAGVLDITPPSGEKLIIKSHASSAQDPKTLGNKIFSALKDKVKSKQERVSEVVIKTDNKVEVNTRKIPETGKSAQVAFAPVDVSKVDKIAGDLGIDATELKTLFTENQEAIDQKKVKAIDLENRLLKQQIQDFETSLTELITKKSKSDKTNYQIDSTDKLTTESKITVKDKNNPSAFVDIELPERLRDSLTNIKKTIRQRAAAFTESVGFKSGTKVATKLASGTQKVGKLLSLYGFVSVMGELQQRNERNELEKATIGLRATDLILDNTDTAISTATYITKKANLQIVSKFSKQASSAMKTLGNAVQGTRVGGAVIKGVSRLSKVTKVAQVVSGASKAGKMAKGVPFGAIVGLVADATELGLYSDMLINAETDFEKEMAGLYVGCSVVQTTLSVTALAVTAAFPLAAPLFFLASLVMMGVQAEAERHLKSKEHANASFRDFEKELILIKKLLEDPDIHYDSATKTLTISSKNNYTKIDITEDKVTMTMDDGAPFSLEFIEAIKTSLKESERYKPTIHVKARLSGCTEFKNIKTISLADRAKIQEYSPESFKSYICSRFGQTSLQTASGASIGTECKTNNALITLKKQQNSLNVTSFAPSKQKIKTRNINDTDIEHIIIDGHPKKLIYQALKCIKSNIEGYTYQPTGNQNVMKLSEHLVASADGKKWQHTNSTGSIVVSHDYMGRPIHSYYEGKYQCVSTTNSWQPWYSYAVYPLWQKTSCFQPPTDVHLNFTPAAYNFYANANKTLIYHFQPDQLANALAMPGNKAPYTYGINDTVQLPISGSNAHEEGKNTYKINLEAGGEYHFNIYSGTHLDINSINNTDSQNTTLNLAIQFADIACSFTTPTKKSKKTTSSGRLNVSNNGKQLGICTESPATNQKTTINISNELQGATTQLLINKEVKANQTSGYFFSVDWEKGNKDSVKLEEIASFPCVSEEEVNENFALNLKDLTHHIPAFTTAGCRIHSFDLNASQYHLEQSIQQSNSTEAKKHPNELFESSGWYLISDENIKDHPFVIKNGGLVVAKIWRKNATEEDKEVYRRMDFLGYTWSNQADIPEDLSNEFTEGCYVYHFYDKEKHKHYRQYGFTEIRESDAKTCPNDIIPRKVVWGTGFSDNYSCDDIQILPAAMTNGNSDGRYALSLDIDNSLKESKTNKNKTFLEIVDEKALQAIGQLNKPPTAAQNATSAETNSTSKALPSTSKALNETDTAEETPNYYVDIRNASAINSEGQKVAVKLFLTNDQINKNSQEQKQLVIIPEDESVIALPKGSGYALTAKVKTSDVDGNTAHQISLQKRVCIKDPSLLQKINTELITGDKGVITDKSAKLNNFTPILADVPITHIINRPELGLFICKNAEGTIFSLDHDLSQIHLRAVKGSYLSDKNIALNDTAQIQTEFNALELKYGNTLFPYFCMEAENKNTRTPSVYLNTQSKRLIYIPATLAGNKNQTPLSRNLVILSEQSNGLAQEQKVVVQDFDNQILYEVNSPYNKDNATLTEALNYSFLDKAEEFVYLGIKSKPQSSDITARLPFLNMENIILMPAYLSDSQQEVTSLEIPSTMQFKLDTISLIPANKTDGYATQKINIVTEDTSAKPNATAVIFTKGEEKAVSIIVPTTQKVEGKLILGKPLSIQLEDYYKAENGTESNPTTNNSTLFTDCLSFNGEVINIDELIRGNQTITIPAEKTEP